MSPTAPLARAANCHRRIAVVQRRSDDGRCRDGLASGTGPCEVRGTIRCNTLRGGDHGFSLKSSVPQLPGAPQLLVRDNAIEAHLPAIVSDYLRSGVGRGATSDVFVDMRGNWWGDASGPYEPTRNVPGRGDAVGTVIEFAPWHSSRPACAPAR